MKPERLEMAGFAPFRSATEIDFGGLDIFALTGPTGSGKSSVIDAITFALYGRVARYGGRAVEPVISLGAAEARVLFEFTVEGVPYTAARVVRRNPRGGATVAEARLESGGAVLASGADEVGRHVEQLLGLGLDHFNRSVVLPQGEFAAFLHDTPAGQQALVKALLDMGVLDEVRRLAVERHRTAQALEDSARTQLDHLADATGEAVDQAARRLATLEDQLEPVGQAEEQIQAAQNEVRQRIEELKAVQEQQQLVTKVRVPDSVGRLADDLKVGRERLSQAQADEDQAMEAVEKAVEAAAGTPSRPELEAMLQMRQQLSESEKKREAIDLVGLDQEVASATEAVAQARSVRAGAAAAWEEARTRHAAHALAVGLHAGDPCPLCHRPLADEPDDSPVDLDKLKAAVGSAERSVAEAESLLRRAEHARAEAGATHAACVETIDDLGRRLGDAPGEPEIKGLLEERIRLDSEATDLEKALKEARRRVVDARAGLTTLEARERQAWDDYSAARDGVATLGPPAAGRDALDDAWSELAEWAREQAQQLDARVGACEEQAKLAQAELEEQRSRLAANLEELGVGGSGAASARLAAACATAAADLDRVRERRSQRETLEADLARFSQSGGVASALANHLRAGNFVGWFLAEALATLVEGANSLLDDLTRGAYSLALHDRSIEVIDHRNADERRSVRSLSGGETFLVSLALALSLGEQLSNMSQLGGSRLEAIFLDEGFGSLDAETLETVTAVVTELAASGRVVGLVTHVKDLGEQVPVRFEIRPGPGGSTIERIET